MKRPCLKRIVLAAAVAGCLAPRAPAAAGVGGPDDIIGHQGEYAIADGETLLDVARRFDLGFVELRAANPGIDPWLPAPGTRLVLPTAHILPPGPHEGIVLNLAEQRLYFFPNRGGVALTFPVGIGRLAWQTPLGRTKVVGKRENPIWVPPPSIRAEHPGLPKAILPGPHNPLGAYALDLGWEDYLIHGTNRPNGIGRRVSHGCVRLYPQDIATLFRRVAVGTPVTVIDQPVKLGWSRGELYLEVHPSQAQADGIEAHGRFAPERIPGLEWRVARAAGGEVERIDWNLVRQAAAERRGLPVRITRERRAADAVARNYLRSDSR